MSATRTAKVHSHPERFHQTIEIASHRLVADEPRELGGADTGPMPTELLLGALGACTSITVRMYAERKGWALEKVEVEVQMEQKSGENPIFKRVVKFLGNLDDEQRARLLEIANKCPVHKILSNGNRIETHAG